MRTHNRNSQPESEFTEQVLEIKRVSKKTQGGNYISFTALVAVGDKKGRVGVAVSRGREVPQAIRKAMRSAKKNMITVPIFGSTLPHDVRVKYKAAQIIIKPAPKGAGLKVGSVVRTILSLSGITNASGKILRSRNKTTNAYAVIRALEQLKIRNKKT